MSRTLVIVKPHAVQRQLVGTILERFERLGLQIAAIKVVSGNDELWERFYPSDPQWYGDVGQKTLDNCVQAGVDVQKTLGTRDAVKIGKLVKGWLVKHMSSGRAVAVILEGNEAPRKVRLAAGSTLPNNAAPGTIRFDFSCDSPVLANAEQRPVYNIVHASDPAEVRDGVSAVDYEIELLFGER